MHRALAVVMLLLAGCAHDTERPGNASATGTMAGFDPKEIGKTDVDRVADLHRREIFASVRVLSEKLYRRNPREWKKAGHASAEAALDRLLDPRTAWRPPDAAGRRGAEAILLSLRDDFTGDRVAAFVAGVGGMLDAAFDHKTEFFLFDELDPQKLYNSARNLEIAAWKLANARDASGAPLLLSNEMAQGGQPANLSFEREFGKIIGRLDLLASYATERYRRAVIGYVQGVVAAPLLAFLPVK